jgi:hypothetical protein
MFDAAFERIVRSDSSGPDRLMFDQRVVLARCVTGPRGE